MIAPSSTALALVLTLAGEPATSAPPGEAAPGAAASRAVEDAPRATSAQAEQEPSDRQGPQAEGADESVPALIRRCVAAYGGERGAVRLARVRAEGRVSSRLAPGEVGKYTRVFARSSRLRIEVRFPRAQPEVRVLDGSRGFRYGEPAPPAVIATLQLQAARLDLPAVLSEWESRADDRGEVTHEGSRVRVLGLELAQGLSLEIGVDPRSGRIRYVHGRARVGPRPLELFTVYRDYRLVDGVLVAFREEGWANGEPTGEVTLEKVELLEEVGEDSFRP